jgi:hypothetical protein
MASGSFSSTEERRQWRRARNRARAAAAASAGVSQGRRRAGGFLGHLWGLAGHAAFFLPLAVVKTGQAAGP